MNEEEVELHNTDNHGRLVLGPVQVIHDQFENGFVGIADVVELSDTVADLRRWLQSTYDLRCQLLRRLQKEGVKVSEMVQATGVTKQAVHLMLAKGRRLDDAQAA